MHSRHLEVHQHEREPCLFARVERLLAVASGDDGGEPEALEDLCSDREVDGRVVDDEDRERMPSGEVRVDGARLFRASRRAGACVGEGGEEHFGLGRSAGDDGRVRDREPIDRVREVDRTGQVDEL